VKPVALFLVKNGIGYGHIRRALLVADELARRGELRPVVVSQARTLDLLRTSTVPVLNLPLLHRVPSAVGEDAYLDILERVVERLGPAVAIEDTYPDQRYGSLDALRGVPRVLLLRRLDGESFDTLRSRGAFAPYDRILLAQDGQDVDDEGHSGETLLALRHSDRVRHVGNVHRVPTLEEIDTEKRRHGGPLVVVNGGAGGDQLHDGYGHRLLAAVHRTAADLHAAGHPARFVVVTGPYYAGPALPALPNLTVHRFTTALPALLASADVAVIKPGNNALAEALQGGAHLVLVPDASFLEGTDGNARRVVDRYGGAVVDTGGIDAAVRGALARTAPRSERAPHPANALRAAADSITRAARTRPLVRPHEACILVRTTCATPRLPSWAAAIHPLAPAGPPTPFALVESPPNGLSPQDVVDRGTELLVSAGPPPPPVARWLRAAPAHPALPVVQAGRVAVGPHDPAGRILNALAQAVTDPTNRAVVLDLRRINTTCGNRVLDTVTRWIAGQPVDTVPATRLLTDTATRLLHGGAP
jgi:UDP-N-acetylglucosamine:LPS N-acetylglucosamine transferase